jgi:hypothetical protein
MGCTKSSPSCQADLKSLGWHNVNFGACEFCPSNESAFIARADHNGNTERCSKSSGHGAKHATIQNALHPTKRQAPSKIFFGVQHELNKSMQNTNSSEIDAWHEREIALLESSVIAVAKSKDIQSLSFRELNNCFVQGEFKSDDVHIYWHRVAAMVRSRNAVQCCLKYKDIHTLDVARFAVKEHSQKRRSRANSTCDINKLPDTAAPPWPHHEGLGDRAAP